MRRDTLAKRISKITGYDVVATDGSEYQNGHHCRWQCEEDGCNYQLGQSLNISDYVDLTVAVGEYDEAIIKVRISRHQAVYGGCDVHIYTNLQPLSWWLPQIADALTVEVNATKRFIERRTNV
jgi:hypothetical protein